MIRFCDREVGFVEYDSLNRKELLEYFASGHEEDVLCVYDNFSTMGYIGKITEYSLQHSININGAIQEEYVIMDKDMWYEARDFFAYRNGFSKNNFLLPIFSKEGQLICFAYEDEDANREIRQLRELSELPEALQFSDIYPEYKCVKIHEFNELAYFFAKYLESRNVAVQVEGAMWQVFFEGEEFLVPDYECLNIYAEGTWEKKHNWRENLLRSVSVEFECVDKIYEANIKNGTIKDAKGSCAELLEYLKGEKEIVLYGTGRDEQNAYDYLKGNGIDICCFIGIQDEERNHVLFGKKIISPLEARAAYKNAVFIECTVQNSAWGLGRVDYYDYIGYRRNERFILLKDYIEIPENNLENLIRQRKIALLGDIRLCRCLLDYLKQWEVSSIGYLPALPENIDIKGIPVISANCIDRDTICLIVLPEYILDVQDMQKIKEKENQIKTYLDDNNINNYTDYFSYMIPFINMEKDRKSKYTKEWLLPKKIILGSIETYSGNAFLRGLLDNHPEIILINYNYLNHKLFWICIHLSMEPASNILSVFWKLMEEDNVKISNPEAFNVKMEEMLAYDSKFTSQELFVMIHIAYMNMYRKMNTNINEMVIYWEPHYVPREITEDYVKWLGTEKVPCDIINVVRDICMKNGSGIKSVMKEGMQGAYYMTLKYPSINKKKYSYSNRLVVRFEDIKCNPEEALMEICHNWDISWNDAFMDTTCHGKENTWNNGVREVGGFDLEPVYNTYEQFFSEFDRFRMVLINAPYQRKYGYPYVELAHFTRKELQEMFLKEFRFENLGDTELYKDSLDYRIELQMQIKEKLQRTRMIELL